MLRPKEFFDPQGAVLWGGIVLFAVLCGLILQPVYSGTLLPQLLQLPGFQDPDSVAHTQAMRYVIIWLFAAIVLVYSLGFASVTAVPVFSRYCFPGGTAMVIFAVVLLSMGYFVYKWPSPEEAVGQQVDYIRVLGRGPWSGIEHMEAGARRLAQIGTITSVHVLLALFALSVIRPRGATHIEMLEDLRERLLSIKVLIYLTGIGLTAGVIATGSLLSAHIGPELVGGSLVAAKSFIRTTTLTYGGMFSLLLLVAALPATLLLTQRIRSITLAVLPGSTSLEQKQFLQDNGLVSPLSSQAWQLLAVLLPALTSAIGDPLASALGALAF